MFVGEVSALVGGGRADDGDLRRNGRKEQPVLAGKRDPADNRLGRRLCVHCAAFARGIDERVHPDLGQHARPLGRRLAVHVEENARRDVIGRDRVAADHFPDRRRLGGGWTGRIGARQNARQTAGLGEMIDALHPPHVAGRDRMKGRDVARAPFGVEPLPIALSTASGHPSAEDDETVTIAPSGMRRAASEAEMTFCLGIVRFTPSSRLRSRRPIARPQASRQRRSAI